MQPSAQTSLHPGTPSVSPPDCPPPSPILLVSLMIPAPCTPYSSAWSAPPSLAIYLPTPALTTSAQPVLHVPTSPLSPSALSTPSNLLPISAPHPLLCPACSTPLTARPLTLTSLPFCTPSPSPRLLLTFVLCCFLTVYQLTGPAHPNANIMFPFYLAVVSEGHVTVATQTPATQLNCCCL